MDCFDFLRLLKGGGVVEEERSSVVSRVCFRGDGHQQRTGFAQTTQYEQAYKPIGHNSNTLAELRVYAHHLALVPHSLSHLQLLLHSFFSLSFLHHAKQEAHTVQSKILSSIRRLSVPQDTRVEVKLGGRSIKVVSGVWITHCSDSLYLVDINSNARRDPLASRAGGGTVHHRDYYSVNCDQSFEFFSVTSATYYPADAVLRLSIVAEGWNHPIIHSYKQN